MSRKRNVKYFATKNALNLTAHAKGKCMVTENKKESLFRVKEHDMT